VAGHRLNESELLQAIEESTALNSQLDDIASRFKIQSKALESKSKLRTIIKYLTDSEYLKVLGSTGSVFIATAKWSLMYDQLEFVLQYEGVNEDVVVQTQQDMFT
jgi:hypothetical protein